VNNIKIWLRLAAAILLAVIIAGAGLIHWAVSKQTDIAVDQARDFADSVHQMTLAGLTGMMITGTMPLRSLFLDQIKKSNHIESLRVFRGEAVVKQFGAGLEGESPTSVDEVRVLQRGVAEYLVVPRENGTDSLRAIIPVLASNNYLGKNCLNCHNVSTGTVLGAVSMDISLERAEQTSREFARNAMTIALALCLPLGLFIWFFVSRLVARPLRQMTGGLNRIAAGDIEAGLELPVRGSNEIGLATEAFNRVMGKAGDMLQQQRLSRIVFENSFEGITVTDANARIQMVNKAFTDTTGYSEAEAIGQTPALLKSGKQDEKFYADFWSALKQDGEWRGEIWNRRKNGSVYAEWLNVSAVRNPGGEVENYVAIFSDITERKEREELMVFRAFHDALTGLPNRLLFRDRLEQALAQAKRHPGRTPAVMFLDLDRFKQINDTYGHDAGDMLLKEVANRLCSCVRSADTVARLAGDEFTVLLPEITDELTAHSVADKILETMREPITLGGEERSITTSIGVSISPRDGADADTLMKCADMAMYFVKGSGRADKCFYSAELHGRSTRRMEMEAGLRVALTRREFVLNFQPLMNVGSGTPHCMEVLIRWQTPAGDTLYPEDFLALADEVGLMLPIGEWVLETACNQAHKWQVEGREMAVAVNLGATEFRRPDLAAIVRDALRRNGLSPQLLELGIAECLVMHDAEYSERVCRELADLGVGLAVVDFGSGYSNLAALKRLPVKAIRLDHSLSRGSLDDNDSAVLAAIIRVAEVFGLCVVAENAETQERVSAKAVGNDASIHNLPT
jgi:diguanylate cyclase (GGDEF)-like protein/PAS domain S-box-containing protein